MKDYRDKELKYLLLILIFLFLIWCTPILGIKQPTSKSSILEALYSSIESVIISGILSLGVFLCDCSISSHSKDKLVGLFLIPRPGETIFSRIKNGDVIDDRFQVADARIKYCDIISNLPAEKQARRNFENSKWYKIYLIYQDSEKVKQSQKDSLVCRDLFVETTLFFLLYCLSLISFPQQVMFSWKFITVLIAIFIVSNRATHVKMSRFVNTVISEDIAENSKGKI